MLYRVEINIDVEAVNHVEAAKQAWSQLQDPAATPPITDVWEIDEYGQCLGRVVGVDLESLEKI